MHFFLIATLSNEIKAAHSTRNYDLNFYVRVRSGDESSAAVRIKQKGAIRQFRDMRCNVNDHNQKLFKSSVTFFLDCLMQRLMSDHRLIHTYFLGKIEFISAVGLQGPRGKP